jgi:hypothetical protein
MKTRTLLLSTAALAFLAVAVAPVSADDCRASATLKDVKKAGSQTVGSAVGERGSAQGRVGDRLAMAGTYELLFDIEVSGCHDSAGRPHKFAKAAYGTITYTFKKKYGGVASTQGESEEKSTVNWNDDDKEISLTSKLEGKDAKGFFEVSDVKVQRTVCGCR